MPFLSLLLVFVLWKLETLHCSCSEIGCVPMASNEGSSATSSHRGVRGRFVHERANNMGLNKLRDNTEMFMWSLCNYLRNKFKLLQHSDVTDVL
ncbi:hypothetical protein S245_005258 [Arachis hypogaea]